MTDASMSLQASMSCITTRALVDTDTEVKEDYCVEAADQHQQ